MAHQHTHDYFFATADYCRIFWQKWIPKEPVQAVLIFQHGLGEHSSRYQNLIDAMDGSGLALYALDARGHGKSEGKRGHVQSFSQYIDDLDQMVNIIKTEQPGRKIFLLGHSLGAVVAVEYAFRHHEKLQGLLLSSSGILPHMTGYLTIARRVTKILAHYVPDLSLGAYLKLRYLSHDEQWVDNYRADPLTHGKATPALGHALFSIYSRHIALAPGLRIPLFIFHGTGDKITNPQGSEAFYQHVGSKDKTLKLYEGLYHETMNEIPVARAEVLSDVRKWIEERL